MFEISGDDIANLGDADLRTLVARLALAGIRANGSPSSCVTAGGDQDAADGGLDVRIECPSDFLSPDFVPRRLTGFQVKKPDMPVSAIRNEMRPNGILRDVIRELADASGAYVIVSAQGSVADKPLADRREAIRDSLNDLPNAADLHTDFYDRDRISTWVNAYPGIVTWVRSRVGRSLSGWSGIGDWEGGSVGNPKPFLLNDKACLIDESSNKRENLAISEGITRLRASLRMPGNSIRLIGLSGLGKTRLVQALFEKDIGEDPLDLSIAVYTDYSEETVPTARNMARDLVARGQRAILIIDNCNPATHAELARLCTVAVSKVSLITVEYDVRDDEPEHTDVFRLQSASPELVTEWLKQGFFHISQTDREKVAEFSDGNFRVAGALAQTPGTGETLGSLRSRDLFERIFRQRNEPNQELLHRAEDLSLLYSIDGEDVSADGELAQVSTIRSINARLLYEALAEMRERGVVQVRGRFRAILPHAIANRLAAHALERIPPSDFDRFCAALPRRMLTSVSRRISYLHDSPGAKAVVVRWLLANGPLGDLVAAGEPGFQIIANVAPVAPEEVLDRLQRELNGLNGHRIFAIDNPLRHEWIRLIKALGYDRHMFEAATTLLARFVAEEKEGQKGHSANEAFSELFHLYLSGTRASPEQRRAVIKQLALSGDPNLRRSASVALDAILVSRHFSSVGSFDFGARSRDWGWQPTINKDVWDWLEEAIRLAIELAPHLTNVRDILARHLRELWHYDACHDALDQAATALIREGPWTEGWIASQTTLRVEREKMPENVRTKLEKIIVRLKPVDLLNHARAVVLHRGGSWDFTDGEDDGDTDISVLEKASRSAQKIGQLLAKDPDVRRKFVAELLVAPLALQAFECGRGLAEGTEGLDAMWRELVSAYGNAEAETRSATILGGFLYGAHQRNPNFTPPVLEAAIDSPALAPLLPYLQSRIDLDEEGIARLRRAIAKGVLVSANFRVIATGVVLNSPPVALGTLLEDIATLSDGVEIGLDILHMYFYRHREEEGKQIARLITIGRKLLTQVDFSKKSILSDFDVHEVVGICLAGEGARSAAENVGAKILLALESASVSWYDLNLTLKALFETQPSVALNTFLLSSSSHGSSQFFGRDFGMGTPIDNVDPTVLRQWADHDAEIRYPALSRCIPMFSRKNHEETGEVSPLFLSMLDHAPDKRLFLGNFWDRIHPRNWSGSLAYVLLVRKKQVMKLAEHGGEQIRAWIAEITPELDSTIEDARKREREREESFE